MTDLVKLYNPANAASLTPEQLEGLQKLDSAQIKELAIAYPNMTMNKAYLLIVDTKDKLPIERQLPKLSTFENLWNLREKNGQRGWVSYSFKGTYKSKTAQPVRAKRTEVLDLSDTELMSLPGFKKSGDKEPVFNAEALKEVAANFKHDLPEKVRVTKIKKVAKAPVKKTKK